MDDFVISCWLFAHYIVAVLGRFMFRRRLWFTLNDERKSIAGYRVTPLSTTDQSLPRPTVEIELQSAGIYVNSNDKHQFTIALVGTTHYHIQPMTAF
jgi:hypothetical protein